MITIITVTKQQILEAEREHYFYKLGQAGGFTTGLFDALTHAHPSNMYKLADAFPGEVYIFALMYGKISPDNFRIVGEENV